MKKFMSCLVVLFLGLSLTGCGNSDSNDGNASNGDIQATVRVNGSTSMEKLVNGLSEVILEEYPGLTLEPQFTGSSAGIEALLSGTADIGTSSRALKDEEKEKGIVENVVAIDGIAVITHSSNDTTTVTKDELIKIYKGEITNWSEVGGSDQNIVVMGREAGSGTRAAFEEILKVEDECQYAQELNETGAVMAKVASTPGAIGYVSLDVVDDTVKPLELEGVAATEATIKDGSYALQRPFVMATKGEISEQSDAIKAIFDFMNSDAGKKLIEDVGLVYPN